MIKGTVLSTKGERAKVRINFKLTDEKGLRAYVDCWNPISAHPGDNVTIEYRKIDEKKAKVFVIALPVLCVLAGFIFGYSVANYFEMDFWYYPFLVGSVLAWSFVTFNYIRIFRRDAMSDQEQLTVASIDPVEFEFRDDENDGDKEKTKSFLYSGR